MLQQILETEKISRTSTYKLYSKCLQQRPTDNHVQKEQKIDDLVAMRENTFLMGNETRKSNCSEAINIIFALSFSDS